MPTRVFATLVLLLALPIAMAAPTARADDGPPGLAASAPFEPAPQFFDVAAELTWDTPAPYIQARSRYGWKAVCVSRIETGEWTAYWNPIAHGRWREHAQGYFGWLPSTFRTVSEQGDIMNLDHEIDAFDTMLDQDRGGEFYGLGGYGYKDGTGPCYRS
jgi:hypothetical protein